LEFLYKLVWVTSMDTVGVIINIDNTFSFFMAVGEVIGID